MSKDVTVTIPAIWVPRQAHATETPKRVMKLTMLRNVRAPFRFLTGKLRGGIGFSLKHASLWVAVFGVAIQQTQLDIAQREKTHQYIQRYEGQEIRYEWHRAVKSLEALFTEINDSEPRMQDVWAKYDQQVLSRLGATLHSDNRTISLNLESPELRQVADRTIKHLKQVLRCVDFELCDQETANLSYRKDVCDFRFYLFPYLSAMSDLKNRAGKDYKLSGYSQMWYSHFGDIYSWSERLCIGT